MAILATLLSDWGDDCQSGKGCEVHKQGMGRTQWATEVRCKYSYGAVLISLHRSTGSQVSKDYREIKTCDTHTHTHRVDNGFCGNKNELCM